MKYFLWSVLQLLPLTLVGLNKPSCSPWRCLETMPPLIIKTVPVLYSYVLLYSLSKYALWEFYGKYSCGGLAGCEINVIVWKKQLNTSTVYWDLFPVSSRKRDYTVNKRSSITFKPMMIALLSQEVHLLFLTPSSHTCLLLLLLSVISCILRKLIPKDKKGTQKLLTCTC